MKTKKILFILLFCNLVLFLNAQSYEFTVSSHEYSDLKSPISLTNGLTWNSPNLEIPIGFDFKYFDASIDKIFIQEGCLLSLDTLDENMTYFLSPCMLSNDVMDRAYDSVLGAGQPKGESHLSYELSGNIGERILKIEWKNVGYDKVITSAYLYPDNFANYQVWLFEGSNDIEIHYGPYNISNPDRFYRYDSGPCVFFSFNMHTGSLNEQLITLSGNPTSPKVNYYDIDFTSFDGSIPDGTVYRFRSMKSGEKSLSKGVAKDLVKGTYNQGGFNSGAGLHLKDDNTFSHAVSILSCLGASSTDQFIGEYKIKKDKIIFNPSVRIESHYYDGVCRSRDTVQYSREDHNFRDTLFIVLWRGEIYLLGKEEFTLWGYPSKNDFFEFVNDINSRSGFYHGNYWNKNCHCTSSLELEDQIPLPWRDLLLGDVIIDAKVIDVVPLNGEDKNIKSIITIDKGTQDGLKIGMRLYANKNRECPCNLEIIEINKKSSKGYGKVCGPNDCAVGTQVSTYQKL